jgi:integrase
VSCGYAVDGKQVKQFHTWRPDEGMTKKQIEKEVNRQAVLFEESCKLGQVTATAKFQDYATEYLTKVAPSNLKAGTLANYKNYSRRVFAELGHMRMDKITPRHIQKFIYDMGEGVRLDRYRQGALKPKTIKNHVAFVSSIFEYAIKMQVVTSNPCRAVMLPKDIAQEDVQIYTVEETQEILGHLYQEDKKNFQFVIYFMLAVYTGFRRGELLGLEWKDIDFDRQIISLNRTSLYTKDKGVFTDSLKTRTSYRTLKLPTELMDVLKQFKDHQADYIKRLGTKWVTEIKGLGDKMVANDRLFTQWDGKPMFTNSPSLFFGRFCKRKGLKYRKGHSLRHFNASLQINAGVDVKTVSSNLGHSMTSTTLNIYCKMFQAAQAASMDKIVGVLGLPSIDAC